MTRDLSLSALALCPVARGYGFVFYEGAARPVAWAVRHHRVRASERNALTVEEVETMLDAYQPDELVLEDWSAKTAQRSARIQRLHQAIVNAAQARGIGISRISRGEVRNVFKSVGAVTRHEIAQTIARQFPGIAHRLPKKRRAWDSEQTSSSLFAAAALGVAFYSLPGEDNGGLILSPYYLPGTGPL